MASIEFTVNHGDGNALSPVRTDTAGRGRPDCSKEVLRLLGGRKRQLTPSTATAAAATSGEDKCGSGDQGENKRQSGAAETCMRTDGMMILKHHPMMLANRIIFPGAGFTSL